MTNCCSPGSGFPSASSMQQMSTNNVVVWEEISQLQQAILSASSPCQIDGGKMCITVGGTTPMTFLSGVETVTVVQDADNYGSGYFTDTPGVLFVPPLGVIPSVVATGTVTTNGGSILSITITNEGVDYHPVPATLVASSIAGDGAILIPLVNASGQIVGIDIQDPGAGYTTSDSIIATRAVAPNSLYVNATFLITAVSVTGAILSITILNPGSGYQDSVTTTRIMSTLDPLVPYPLGIGFDSTVLLTPGTGISSVVISNIGAGYVDFPPYLVITDSGTGATTLVSVVDDHVSAVSVLTHGVNYTQNATGTILNPPTADAPTLLANPVINVNENTFGTTPSLYYQVWAGTVTNKPISTQLNAVLSYFKALNYTIIIESNPNSSGTIQWKICW